MHISARVRINCLFVRIYLLNMLVIESKMISPPDNFKQKKSNLKIKNDLTFLVYIPGYQDQAQASLGKRKH